MISLKKGKKPPILVLKEDEWKNDLMSYIQKSEKPPKSVSGRYSHKEIKTALLEETYGKCAYCESKFRHVDHGDVEHIVPKKLFPEKSFDWENLTIGCGICNGNKSSYFSNTSPLLNPYVDKPEEALLFLGPLVVHQPGNTRAAITKNKLQLNRGELYQKRQEFIEKQVMPLIEWYVNTPDDELRKQLYDDLVNLTNSDQEFSSMIRHVLHSYKILS